MGCNSSAGGRNRRQCESAALEWGASSISQIAGSELHILALCMALNADQNDQKENDDADFSAHDMNLTRHGG